jgi:hypothetical protein
MKMTRTFASVAMAAMVAVAAQLSMADGIAASSYVQNGLVACWDGIENAGAGTHDAGATVWKDIVGGREFALTGVTVDADRMTFAGNATSYGALSAAGTAATFGAAMNGTLEIVYVTRDNSVSQILLQTPKDSVGMAFGDIISGTTHVLVPYTGAIAQPAFAFSSGAVTNSVSVRYTSGAPVSARANGAALSRLNTGSLSGEGTETIIGTRNDKRSGHFPGSIYCIRLYSRKLTDGEIAYNNVVDQARFRGGDMDSILYVSSKSGIVGTPTPVYGAITDLSAGDTREVSCGTVISTNATGTVEYRCTGWKLYNGAGVVVDSGDDTSFTYTHPSPAEYRRLEWQWEVTKRFTDFSNYVQTGLIACWDGIANAGAGAHADNAAVWKDIVGGYEFALTNVTVVENGISFAGNETSYGTLSAAGTAATFDAAKNGTMEVVFVSRNASVPQVLVQTPAGNGMTFGYSSGNNAIVPFSGSVQKPSFPFNIGTSMHSFSVRYSSGASTSPAFADGSNLNTTGGGCWTPGEGDETFVGNRASKANGFPGTIYCIRLYSRQLTAAEIIANHAVDALRFANDTPDSTLAISGTPEGIGAPVPAYGYLSELSAGDTRVVTCGKVTWKDADDAKFSCVGWKLYDANGAVVGSGSGTTFTYTHPSPAAYRRLEWQWKESVGVGLFIYVR